MKILKALKIIEPLFVISACAAMILDVAFFEPHYYKVAESNILKYYEEKANNIIKQCNKN